MVSGIIFKGSNVLGDEYKNASLKQHAAGEIFIQSASMHV
jgi:hypothetical protein